MKKAWMAYKERWRREEAALKELEEKKMLFRLQLDRKREMYEHLSEEERVNLKESMRLFRNPNFANDKLGAMFHSTDDSSKPGKNNNTKNSFRQDKLSKKKKLDDSDIPTIQDMMKTNPPRPKRRLLEEDEPEYVNAGLAEKEKKYGFYGPGNEDPVNLKGAFGKTSREMHEELFRQPLQDMKQKWSQVNEEWQKTAFLEEGGQHSVRHNVRPQPEFRVPKGLALTLVLLAVIAVAFHTSEPDPDTPAAAAVEVKKSR